MNLETASPAPAAPPDPDAPPSGLGLRLSAWGALVGLAGSGLAMKDVASGRYLYANAVLLGWLGREAGECVGRTDGEIFDAATAVALRTADQTAVAQGVPMAAEHRLALAGQAREFVVWRTCEATDGGVRCLISLWSDLAQHRQQEAQTRGALTQIEQLQAVNEALRRELADQALRDPASGLYAKAHFEDQLRREVDLSSREHREFAIVFIEIDAHAPAGEGTAPTAGGLAEPSPNSVPAVQASLGRLLRSGTRAMDAACRFDERRFAVLLSGVGLATAHARMEGLRRRCAADIVVSEGRELRFTVAMGVASFPHTAHTQAELVQACAAALQEAQRRGGNHVALAAIRLDPS